MAKTTKVHQKVQQGAPKRATAVKEVNVTDAPVEEAGVETVEQALAENAKGTQEAAVISPLAARLEQQRLEREAKKAEREQERVKRAENLARVKEEAAKARDLGPEHKALSEEATALKAAIEAEQERVEAEFKQRGVTNIAQIDVKLKASVKAKKEIAKAVDDEIASLRKQLAEKQREKDALEKENPVFAESTRLRRELLAAIETRRTANDEVNTEPLNTAKARLVEVRARMKEIRAEKLGSVEMTEPEGDED